VAQLSPRDPRDALYPLKCCPIIVRITQRDRVSIKLEFLGYRVGVVWVILRLAVELRLVTDRQTDGRIDTR